MIPLYKNECVIYGRFAAHIRLDDKRRIEIIKKAENVEHFYIIWESEFRENSTEVVNYIVEILELNRGK